MSIKHPLLLPGVFSYYLIASLSKLSPIQPFITYSSPISFMSIKHPLLLPGVFSYYLIASLSKYPQFNRSLHIQSHFFHVYQTSTFIARSLQLLLNCFLIQTIPKSTVHYIFSPISFMSIKHPLLLAGVFSYYIIASLSKLSPIQPFITLFSPISFMSIKHPLLLPGVFSYYLIASLSKLSPIQPFITYSVPFLSCLSNIHFYCPESSAIT